MTSSFQDTSLVDLVHTGSRNPARGGLDLTHQLAKRYPVKIRHRCAPHAMNLLGDAGDLLSMTSKQVLKQRRRWGQEGLQVSDPF